MAFWLAVGAPGASAQTRITVVYPRPDQVVQAVDSTFIFGNVVGLPRGADWRLEVNGQAVTVHRDGGFLAFVPVTPGDFVVYLAAYGTRHTPLAGALLERRQLLADVSVLVKIPLPLQSVPLDTLLIAGDYRPPLRDLVLAAGDMLHIQFLGTPGMEAWSRIPGVADSIPMTESDPRQQPYWGEAVFGSGAVPDSVLLRGVYSGFYVVPESVAVKETVIKYYLAPPKKLFRRYIVTTHGGIVNPLLWRFLFWPDSVSAKSAYRVSFNSPDFPFTVRFTDSVRVIRHGPALGYFSIFQPAGAQALAVGAEGDWYRLRLSPTQSAWVAANAVVPLPKGILPPRSQVYSLRTYGGDDSLAVEFPLQGQHPFRVIEDDARTLRVQLFGVTSNTDWIRYDFADPLVDIMTWSQPEPELFELRLKLTEDLWGYDTYYAGNTFYLKLNKPPRQVRSLRGKVVVVDPGHAADPGAIGPTGLTEAEANLNIALELEKQLRSKGAQVVMTRRDMSHVPLNDRPVVARQADADLFVSVHNNALPDGVNPFVNNGVSTYYYHPHSIALAKAVQRELVDAVELPDHGLFHGNLAVNRPTQYPAVLVECAFMMIPEQEALLKTVQFRRKVAKAIVTGIERFLEAYDRGNRK